MNEDKITKIMNILELSREEAIELIKEDEEVDKMTKASQINGDLSKEQIKAMKQAKAVDRKPTVFKLDNSKRKKEENSEKKMIIECLRSALEAVGGTDFDITNPEREFLFKIGDTKYKITLAVPRK